MLILRHNSIPIEDLFRVEQTMQKVADRRVKYTYDLDTTLLDKPRCVIYGMLLGCADRLGIFSTMRITASDFLDFVIEVDRSYLPNPYHSFYHAADVAFMIYHMLIEFEVETFLSRIDIVALYVAALCHDVGHPGFNNNYQVKQQTPLAQRYDNKSVLESYSCSLTLNILDKHKILRNVGRITGEKTTEDQMRASIVKMILATDMVFHYELQANLGSLIEITAYRLQQREPTGSSMSATTTAVVGDDDGCSSGLSTPNSGSSSEHCVTDIFQGEKSPLPHFEKRLPYFGNRSCGDVCALMLADPVMELQERQMLCQILLHAADISNPLRPWPLCHRWSMLVCQEFFRQGDEEKKHGLEVSPSMDRDCVTQTSVGVEFGDYVVCPFFELFATLFPRADALVQQLKQNRCEWEQVEDSDNSNIVTTSTTSFVADSSSSDWFSQVTSTTNTSSVMTTSPIATSTRASQCDQCIQHGRQPSDMLPDSSILNPEGRRVSIAAGMVVIPDQMEEIAVETAPTRLKRKLLGPRSVSDGGNTLTKMKECIKQHHLHKNSQELHTHAGSSTLPPPSSSIAPSSSPESTQHPRPATATPYLRRHVYKPTDHDRKLNRSDSVDACLERRRKVASSPHTTI